ncbi:Uncharacterized conserved protein, DUF169 family [Desulfatibacillum alkenivorans DSM 16219]|jgi:uncharacterized protein (DUF169 family)|uniref:Uncharacterized conserved protein, DUF169 family n=1 Tax=Desulfatibacillum alkenivorans DSM 16219 TaxID=1121393 RepID=A0A1M6S1F1_9BACT|nr:DUF169 domain-containing protein [Desulfatibacillum alkenivorans]SHK38634.1 Uncharacterized conserved protein, DUF169 family [Desulfatibacillum alkenivorans DSM 16219]
MKDLNECHEAGRRFEQYLRVSTFPLAVRLMRSEEEIQPGFKRPSKDLGLQNFVCQNFKMVRTYGWTMAVTPEDTNCHLARLVYGWDEQDEDYMETGHKFNIGLYAKDMETSLKLEENIFRLEGKYPGLIISPLARTKVAPDVVLIYCLPAQATRLIQSYLYMKGGALEFSSTGRIGSCHEGVAKTMLTQKPQFVVLGNGDRVWGGAQDSEVMFTCPADQLDIMLEGLEATHAAGLRYPIPSYMNYAPGFQADFKEKALERAGGTIIKE